MTLEDCVTRLATLAAIKKLLVEAEGAQKSFLAAELTRGTVYAFDGDENQLGYATVPKPTQPKPVVTIDDEAAVLPWAVEMFGDSAMSMRLTEQGRKSVTEFVLALHEKGAELQAGVTVTVPEPRDPTPRFTPDKNIVELIRAAVQRGEIDYSTVLELEGDLK